MKSRWFLICLVLIVTVLSTVLTPSYSQSSINVTATVAPPQIEFSGVAGSYDLILITEDSFLTATTEADYNGIFDYTINAGTIGLHTFTIYAEDSNGLFTSTYSQVINADKGSVELYSNIILSPTLNLNESKSSIIATGNATSNSQINLYVNSLYSGTFIASSNGFYSISIPVNNILVGENNSVVVDESYNDQISNYSLSSYFTLKSQTFAASNPVINNTQEINKLPSLFEVKPPNLVNSRFNNTPANKNINSTVTNPKINNINSGNSKYISPNVNKIMGFSIVSGASFTILSMMPTINLIAEFRKKKKNIMKK